MTRTVHCVFLSREAEGFEAPPYPGPVGERIFREISKDAWRQWLERQVMIINEYQLSTSDPASVELLEQHMLGFLFGEGDLGQMPAGFTPRRKK